jgi:hypothetical protein
MAIARRGETVAPEFIDHLQEVQVFGASVLKRSRTHGNPIRFLRRLTGRVAPELYDRVYASHSYVNAGKTRKHLKRSIAN